MLTPLETEKTIKRQFAYSAKNFRAIRPLITVPCGLAIAAAGIAGCYPADWGILVGLSLVSNDMTKYPIYRLRTLAYNLTINVKVQKSRIGFGSIAAGYVAGLIAALFFTTTAPGMTAFLVNLITQVNPLTLNLLICQAIGGGAAYSLGKPTTLGALLGVMVAMCLPTTLPATIYLYGFTLLFGGFVAALLSKHLTRAWYYLNYGASNADGYHFARGAGILSIDQRQSDELGVPVTVFSKFRQSLLQVIQQSKKASSLFDELLGSRVAYTAALKNIFYLLLTATTDDLPQLTALLAITKRYARPSYQYLSPRTINFIHDASEPRDSAGLQDLGIPLVFLKLMGQDPNKQTADAIYPELADYHQIAIQTAISTCNKLDDETHATKNNFDKTLNELFDALSLSVEKTEQQSSTYRR